MAKVFKITEGLETLGAMKTGGQGSVYKGQRTGTIYTAIKILPTPIFGDTADNKNFISFQNEVQKLQRVNEVPNPNVVKFVSSGITESGNLPYIEMEYIEGPDLEELLKPPHPPVFVLKEVLKVAEHLAHALAHCHKLDIKHGDIKSNNVKFNIASGNYVLLDFGLAIMSEEQRRTSLRHAGAVEFMAPEQNEGLMLFQTDIYSYGVILFELLTGVVPFALSDNTETARNVVRVAHLEKSPPDISLLRKQKLAESGMQDQQHELNVPLWLLNLVYKCLQKNATDRFADGVELYDHYCARSVDVSSQEQTPNARLALLENENAALRSEIDDLKQQLLANKNWPTAEAPSMLRQPVPARSRKKAITAVYAIAVILLLVIIAWLLLPKKNTTTLAKSGNDTLTNTVTTAVDNELRAADAFVIQGKMVEALTIYSTYARKNNAAAMFAYGRLALQNSNSNLTCSEAFDMVKAAADQNYAPAKAFIGFLYANADNPAVLKQYNVYERCQFANDKQAAARYLMEATLQGDTTAARYLNELNTMN